MPISSIFPQYHIMSVSRLPTVTLNTHWQNSHMHISLMTPSTIFTLTTTWSIPSKTNLDHPENIFLCALLDVPCSMCFSLNKHKNRINSKLRPSD